MPRIFVESGDVLDGRVRVAGADALHLNRSLRTRAGESIIVVEAGTVEHGVVVEESARGQVVGRIAWSRPATGEPRLTAHILQALPQRGMDDVVEALAQVGAAAIHPLISSRTVSRPAGAAARRKLEHWRVIAREAAQLSGRARSPVVHPVASLAEACAALPSGALLLAAATGGERPLSTLAIDPARPLAIAIGPEGGFDGSELETLRRGGATMVHLGPRVMPARLAGGIALSLAMARGGDLDAPPAPHPKI